MNRYRAAQPGEHAGSRQHAILHSEDDFANAGEALEEPPFFRWILERQVSLVLGADGAEIAARRPFGGTQPIGAKRLNDAKDFADAAADVDRACL